jgi:hypothetical protein
MKLTETMSLVEKDNRMFFADHPIESKSEYRFWVEEGYYVILTLAYSVVGESPNYHVPIVNFGYAVSIEFHSIKGALFLKPNDLDIQSGLSTKKYFSDPINRSIISSIIEKNLLHYIRQKNPPILIRGPITAIKKTLQRYRDITKILVDSGYEEKIFSVNQMPQELTTLKHNECMPKDEMWMYVKDSKLWDELVGWKAL